MTAQAPDYIFINGIKYSLFTNPLGQYWSKKNPMPPIGLPSTDCWRGYLATWEIIDNCLYLVAVIFHSPGGDKDLDYLFPNSISKIKATWYTGELKIPLGDCLQYVHGGYESTYDSDWFISIKNGNIVSQRYKANY
ncbi:MAG: hypothetical protein NTZ85_02270 [Bacteroidia bacterium]|nr:hypothetical protein [Bacteroidia bacterium]